MAYNAGTLREQIVLQRAVEAGTDAAGNRILRWEPVCEAYAAARDVSGREFWEAAAHQLERIVTLTLRWMDGVSADMRVIWRGEVYEIVQVNHLGYRGDWMTLKLRLIESEAGKHGEL